jgi:hypothetical protein
MHTQEKEHNQCSLKVWDIGKRARLSLNRNPQPNSKNDKKMGAEKRNRVFLVMSSFSYEQFMKCDMQE